MRAIDCQGLAGAFTIGVKQAGFTVLAKKELPGGFGMDNVKHNADVIHHGLEFQEGPWEEWEPMPGIDLVFGNPPCSGFSLLNTAATQKDKVSVRNHRGWDSPINDCMWALVEYGARVNNGRGPLYLAMESVQQAYKKGRNLMQMLRDRMEDRTGREYDLTHLLVSGSSTGAAQRRHRYYMILRRTFAPPIIVQAPKERDQITYYDAISDLMGMNTTTYDPQPYARKPKHVFQSEARSLSGATDWHYSPTAEVGTKHTTQVYALLEHGWPVGGNMEDAVRRYYNDKGELPRGFDYEQIWKKVKRKEPDVERLEDAESFHLGFHQPRRVPWEKPGYVITGSGGLDFIHPEEDRFLTVRECARMQGFPDDWSFGGASSFRQAYSWIGKGVPVQTGRYVAEQVRASLAGEYDESDVEHLPDGEYSEDLGGLLLRGVEIGDRERLIDLTKAWKGVVQG